MLDIRDFQELMKKLYLTKDKNRGLENTFIHLVEEIGELAACLNTNDVVYIQNELADIIAWTCSIANLLKIDIETALLNKYPNKCPKCDKNPCVCNDF